MLRYLQSDKSLICEKIVAHVKAAWEKSKHLRDTQKMKKTSRDKGSTCDAFETSEKSLRNLTMKKTS